MVPQELNHYLFAPNLAERIPFSADELNEPIITVYNILRWVLGDSCIFIEISPNRIIWKKAIENDKVTGKFDTPINFIPIFHLVLTRDKLIGKFLSPIQSVGEKISYMFLY